jgi:hypothetical protein
MKPTGHNVGFTVACNTTRDSVSRNSNFRLRIATDHHEEREGYWPAQPQAHGDLFAASITLPTLPSHEPSNLIVVIVVLLVSFNYS